MCVLLFYLNPDASEEEFYLVLLNVRDEFYNRPTKTAHEWDSNSNIIAGMDMEPGREGGTWLAVSKTGKIASLLNVLQPDDEIYADKKGRGFLAVDYVTGSEDCFEYLKNLSAEGESYNGFTLVTMNLSSFKSPNVAYFSNMSSQSLESVAPGIHAFGNSTSIKCPWPKVTKSKEQFTQIIEEHPSIATKDQLVESLFSLMKDSTCHKPDKNMKKQGGSRSSDFMDKLSSIFVSIPECNYGSRCHTIVLVDGSGNVEYIEKSRTSDIEWNLQHICFKFNL